MDRTITRSGTYSGFLIHVARRRQQWRLLLLPLVGLAGLAYSLRLIDRSRLKAINLGLLVGSRFRRAEIAPLAESYADKVVAKGLHPAALDQIAADREAGYRLLLATASFHLYVDAIARRLGIDDVLATRLDEPDGADHIHARLAGDNCYGDAKFARIGGWMADNDITRDQAHIRAYSDHVSDHPMLRFADEAIATTPSRGLKQLAPRMGWQVVDWRAKR
ncbi:MAG: HAD-IB family hydrolase [Sphingopyxis sp.]|nr:HAD-IB family hydrolase [Sphingopyxis sp.]